MRFVGSTRVEVVAVAAGFALCASACSDWAELNDVGDDIRGSDGVPGYEGEDGAVTPGDVVATTALCGPLAARLAEAFAGHRRTNEGLSYAGLKASHQPDYLGGVGFSARDAAFYEEFAAAFPFFDKLQGTLAQYGFAVAPWKAGPADVLYRVFAADLPIFISADAILHAWHRSFDKLLEQTETAIMIPALGELLDRTLSELDVTEPADRDALFYLAVAKSLFDPDYDAPAAVSSLVTEYLGYVDEKKIQEVSFLGSLVKIDFSQFIPRGHYTNSDELKRYFRAMMWLGRTDLVLHSPIFEVPREEAAARALAAAMSRGGATAPFEVMDNIYRAYVGKTNALTPVALLQLCAEAGLTDCVGDAQALTELYKQQPVPDYSSRITLQDKAPITMRFFPQRFAYDAWVMNQTTTPRLKPALPGGRSMAMPADVAFTLGSDRATELFAQDMTRPFRENLPATLAATRATMVEIPPTDLETTVYNHWLEGLMAASEPTVDARFPQVMRTATWHDHKIETVLASWTEMRHDTILIVEQSMGTIGCQYPKGYVEPIRGLYEAMGDAAARMRTLYVPLVGDFPAAPDFFDHWIDVMDRLMTMSEKELRGEAFSDDDMEFLNDTVDSHGESYGGGRSYNGWYPSLYWIQNWVKTSVGSQSFMAGGHPSGESEPIVADVHTDGPHALALEVGTGHPGIMFVAIDNGGDLSMYAGPVSSYYSLHVPVSERLTDEQWEAKINNGDLPPRPAFAQPYWVETDSE